jgi:hypothetical protein
LGIPPKQHRERGPHAQRQRLKPREIRPIRQPPSPAAGEQSAATPTRYAAGPDPPTPAATPPPDAAADVSRSPVARGRRSRHR